MAMPWKRLIWCYACYVLVEIVCGYDAYRIGGHMLYYVGNMVNFVR